MLVIIIATLISLAAFAIIRFGSEVTPAIKVKAPLVFILPLIALVFEMFTIIPAGRVGVVTTLGTVDQKTLTEGVHFVNPIANVHTVDVRITKAELKNSNASSHDLQTVHTDITLNYRLDPKQVAYIYQQFGYKVEQNILLPAISETFKSVTANYTSTELITKRSEVSHKIHEVLQEKVLKYGLSISDISLTNFGFSDDFEKAIEAKVIAEQTRQKAISDLERIKVEAQSAIEEAKGKAEAIRIQTQAINSAGGKNYVDLKAIEKWSGEVPQYVGTGSAIPFINIGK